MTALAAGGHLVPERMRELLAAARSARGRAYAPYSRFAVGAALLDEHGGVFPGVNVENASFGLSTCAERSALSRAITDGAGKLIAVAIIGPSDSEPLMPCGSCRQILWEHAPELLVITPAPDGYQTQQLRALLPEAFDAASLTPRAP